MCNKRGVTLIELLIVVLVLGALAVVLTCAVLVLLRRRKSLLFGLLWFGLALAPASQIMSHHIHRADRFLYLPLIGLVVMMAIGLRPLGDLLKGRMKGVAVAAVGLWSLLGILSWGQVQTWANSLCMWENCLRVNPGNSNGHASHRETKPSL